MKGDLENVSETGELKCDLHRNALVNWGREWGEVKTMTSEILAEAWKFARNRIHLCQDLRALGYTLSSKMSRIRRSELSEPQRVKQRALDFFLDLTSTETIKWSMIIPPTV